MKVRLDTHIPDVAWSVWEAGVVISGFKLFLFQYIGSRGCKKTLDIYLFGIGVQFKWGD